MKQMLLTLLSSSLIASNCLADTIPNAITLNKGQPAPYPGVLLSSSQAKVIYGELKGYDNVKLINETLKKEIVLHQDNEILYLQEVSDLKQQNLSLDTSLQKATEDNFWAKTLYFGLGVLTSGLIVYAAKRN